MPSLVERVANVATKPLTRTMTVRSVNQVGDGFRRVVLGDASGIAWEVGHKVQVRAGGFNFRTYTPFDWSDDEVSLLIALDATGPGTAMVSELASGDQVSVMGPGRAINFSKNERSPIFIGDETSLALAASWVADGSVPAQAHLFEANDATDIESACAAVGVVDLRVVKRRPDDGHLEDLSDLAVSVVRAAPEALVVVTGRAQTIRAVRGAFKAAGLSPATKVKAHWDPRRSGLD